MMGPPFHTDASAFGAVTVAQRPLARRNHRSMSPDGLWGVLLFGLIQRPAREHPALGDRHLPAPSAQERHEPRDDCDEAVAATHQVVQVQTEPRQPGEESAELDLAYLAHRAEPRHGRHAPFVEVLERLSHRWVIVALESTLDLLGGVHGALDRTLRLAGHARRVHQVADDEDMRMSLHSEVGLDDHPAGAIDFRPVGLLGDLPAERARLHSSRPNLDGTVDAMFGAVLVL